MSAERVGVAEISPSQEESRSIDNPNASWKAKLLRIKPFLLQIGCAVILVMAFFSFLDIFSYWQNTTAIYQQNAQTNITRISLELARNLPYSDNRQETLDALLRGVTHNEHQSRIALFSQTGEIRAHSGSLSAAEFTELGLLDKQQSTPDAFAQSIESIIGKLTLLQRGINTYHVNVVRFDQWTREHLQVAYGVVVFNYTPFFRQTVDGLINTLVDKIWQALFLICVVAFVMFRYAVLPARNVFSHLKMFIEQEGPEDLSEQLPNNTVGDIGRMVMSLRDENLRIQRELAKFHLVAKKTKAAFILTNAREEIEWASPLLKQVTGYELSECIGVSPLDFLINPDHHALFLREYQAARAKGAVFSGELYTWNKAGDPYYLSITIEPVRDTEGSITQYAYILRDNTEQKRSHEQLEETRLGLRAKTIALKDISERFEMQSAELEYITGNLGRAKTEIKLKAQFLATMSHEIRTNMNGIMGMVDLLMLSGLDDTQHDRVKLINNSGQSLLTILNDALDLSKFEAGRYQLEQQAFDWAELLNSVKQLMAPQAEQKSLTLAVEINRDVPEFLKGDPNRLRQILINLLGNAIKFTKKGGIEIRSTQDNAGQIRVEIHDTGIGIAPEQQKRLFTPFSQADSSIAGTYGGTGLGLAIVRELTNLMGGSCGVESKPGEGSTFWFTFPLVKATRNELPKICKNPQEAIQNTSGQHYNILLVEDNPINCELMTAIMEQFGHDLTVVTNGIEAIKAIQKQNFDLVLMDVQMAEMDGLAATKAIRQLTGACAQVPIIACTANAMSDDVEKYLAAGMSAHISKPIQIVELVSCMDRVVKQAAQKNSKTNAA